MAAGPSGAARVWNAARSGSARPMTVGSKGRYTWHVNQSTRPVVQKKLVEITSDEPDDGGPGYPVGGGSVGEEGKLYFHIVPSPWNNASSGSYRVRVTNTMRNLVYPFYVIPAEELE